MTCRCYFCEKEISPFSVTPVLEFPDKTLGQICEECADEQFPGWEEDG